MWYNIGLFNDGERDYPRVYRSQVNYGEITGNYALTDKAISLLESLKPESNSIVKSFVAAGIECDSALTSQALIELRRSYCDARKCIYCKIGHRLLSESAHR